MRSSNGHHHRSGQLALVFSIGAMALSAFAFSRTRQGRQKKKRGEESFDDQPNLFEQTRNQLNLRQIELNLKELLNDLQEGLAPSEDIADQARMIREDIQDFYDRLSREAKREWEVLKMQADILEEEIRSGVEDGVRAGRRLLDDIRDYFSNNR